jgi:hypothetical protein
MRASRALRVRRPQWTNLESTVPADVRYCIR